MAKKKPKLNSYNVKWRQLIFDQGDILAESEEQAIERAREILCPMEVVDNFFEVALLRKGVEI